MIRLTLFLAFSALAAAQAPAPLVWQMQESGTTAGLRGIFSVDGTVAWASGTGGSVLRTIDGGAHWTKCAVPDAATDGATLDFRGVQAWDAKTAIVMSSGKGGLSRLYKTTDGCLHWKLLLHNPEKEGFWDTLYFMERWDGKSLGNTGYLLGDPVNGAFWLLISRDFGRNWIKQKGIGLQISVATQSVFAASNSSFVSRDGFPAFGSGGSGGAFVYSMTMTSICVDDCPPEHMNLDGKDDRWTPRRVPLGQNTDSSGIFSIGSRPASSVYPALSRVYVIVGGDYSNPNNSANTAAFQLAGNGEHWTASTIPPHGYRSAVQWSEALKVWITVGTNGSDISRDDGKTWQPLDDGNWNALSLPFVVGPNGRIAKMNSATLPDPALPAEPRPAKKSPWAK
jgi:photosystem II stability/assembly factor-like uncharacterized protein